MTKANKRKPRNFWIDFENIKTLLIPLCNENTLPSADSLKQYPEGYQLINAISRYHGGIESVAARLGCKTRKSEIEWTEDELSDELKKFSIENNGFPTQATLRKQKRSDLEKAISRSSKNIHEWAEHLGYTPCQKPKGYWKDFENLRREIEKIIVNNKFPTSEMIANNIGHRARHAIYAYHGESIATLAKRMGYEPPNFLVATDGHYVQSGNEYIVDEFLYNHGIQHEVGGLIAPGVNQYKYDFKIGEYYLEIWGYESNRIDGICGVYNKKRKEKEEFYRSKSLKLISINAEFFQQSAKDICLDLFNLLTSCGIVCGDTPKEFDISNIQKHAYYWSEDRILRELKIILNDIGKVPSWEELRNAGRGDLADAIKRYGGFSKFRILLGQKIRSGWDDEKIECELKKIIAEDKKFPIQSRLKELERWDLLRAINRSGGFVKWHIKMGFKPTRSLNRLLKSHRSSER